MFAMQALGLADLFTVMVGAKPLEGGKVVYKVEMGKPDGPSTGGGKQALQPIKLVPQAGGTTLVIGHANQGERTAELRTFALLKQQHDARFRGAEELPLVPAQYEELMKRLDGFFNMQGIKISKAEALPGVAVFTTAAPAPIRPKVESTVAASPTGTAVPPAAEAPRATAPAMSAALPEFAPSRPIGLIIAIAVVAAAAGAGLVLMIK